jgi:hypothetical protein
MPSFTHDEAVADARDGLRNVLTLSLPDTGKHAAAIEAAIYHLIECVSERDRFKED